MPGVACGAAELPAWRSDGIRLDILPREPLSRMTPSPCPLAFFCQKLLPTRRVATKRLCVCYAPSTRSPMPIAEGREHGISRHAPSFDTRSSSCYCWPSACMLTRARWCAGDDVSIGKSRSPDRQAAWPGIAPSTFTSRVPGVQGHRETKPNEDIAKM